MMIENQSTHWYFKLEKNTRESSPQFKVEWDFGHSINVEINLICNTYEP